jgi:hypothetical protein
MLIGDAQEQKRLKASALFQNSEIFDGRNVEDFVASSAWLELCTNERVTAGVAAKKKVNEQSLTGHT